MRKVNILIVEDETLILMDAYRYMSKHYRHVYSALNGKEAIEILEDHKIDVLITDINMPIMCGNDLIKYVVEVKEKFIPTIVTSKHSEMAQKYKDIKCIVVKEKPYNLDQIKETVDTMLDEECLGDYEKIKKATIEAKKIKDVLDTILEGSK